MKSETAELLLSRVLRLHDGMLPEEIYNAMMSVNYYDRSLFSRLSHQPDDLLAEKEIECAESVRRVKVFVPYKIKLEN